ncbi:MAG: AMP-binding protein [Hyphomicrobiaceae bacterium]|nr:AMP-binding protein [Hyphomicrobiaceae bacterium]
MIGTCSSIAQETPPRRFNMAAYCIAPAAATRPNAQALVVVHDPAATAPAEVWTFAQLEEAVLRIASGLKAAGLAPGARILIRLENTSTYALVFFGAIAGGFVPVPTSAQLTEPEAQFLLADSGAEAIAIGDDLGLSTLPGGVQVVTASDIAEMITKGERQTWADTAADDAAFLVYTSGTTARPKGVLHAQRSAFGRRPMYQGWYGIGPNDRMLCAGAFNWTYTLGTGLTDPWANGATAIIYTGEKDPALWPRIIAQNDATIFSATPGLYRQILKYGQAARADFGRLRHGLVAGETSRPGLFEEWTAETGTELYEALGMSEISTYVSSSPSVPRKPGTVGKPQPGRRIAILPLEGGTEPLGLGKEGLLAVHRSDPGLMLGYWNRPQEEAQVYRDEWFIGGDLAAFDEDGYVIHRGRTNDLMNALGYRVSPKEVEAVLGEHPHVGEVACAEVRVRDDVSVIAAFIVPAEGVKPDTAHIQRFAAERLAPYKRPREIVLVDTLPRTPNGKLMRSALTLPSGLQNAKT